MDGGGSLSGPGSPVRRAACVDALCWIRQGHRPERDEILSSGLDQKFLRSNYECLVIQDGLLCKQIGPFTDASYLATVIIPTTLRKEVIRQCHDTRMAGDFYHWKTLKKVKVLQLGRTWHRCPSIVSSLSRMYYPKDSRTRTGGRNASPWCGFSSGNRLPLTWWDLSLKLRTATNKSQW